MSVAISRAFCVRRPAACGLGFVVFRCVICLFSHGDNVSRASDAFRPESQPMPISVCGDGNTLR